MRPLTLFIFCVLLLSSFSSALSSVVRLDLGARTAKPSYNAMTAEMMQESSRISSPFVSPLLAMWARPRRLAYQKYNGAQW
ncbi:hypothetical protein PRIPAC_71729, partial [Pristionchus pacificus]|uniref:Uncharacterized protein n=1 Tax=Pristionchus pacificus TaxID=54126 RepID=A0A2A6CSP9_PRIPA|eukprot:PDM81215.1 hypothetical protein PRIPAC_36218 [Pristionchus pacificus]